MFAFPVRVRVLKLISLIPHFSQADIASPVIVHAFVFLSNLLALCQKVWYKCNGYQPQHYLLPIYLYVPHPKAYALQGFNYHIISLYRSIRGTQDEVIEGIRSPLL